MVILTNPHFMKPMLPGFETGITIPLAFYVKHIDGKTNLATWNLRSDASERTWEVQVDGQTISRGWKDFARAHDLRIGDVVFFRQEGEMEFHVTPFGPSCCEIQYTHPRIKEEADDDDVNEIGGTWAMSFDYCFKVEVIASNLQQDKLSLHVASTRCKALSKQCQETILVNKDGKSWTAKLRFSESAGIHYITKGWRNLCVHNRCAIGDLFVFNMVGDGKNSPLMCQVPESKECQQILRKYKREKSGESSGEGLQMV